MNHLNLLKRAFNITWRYRPLWVFGFFLALCGGGGGGGGNFGSPGSGNTSDGNFGNFPGVPNIDENTIIAIIIGFLCLIFFLVILGVLVRVITRTALIGMVRQITEAEAITIADGWRLGRSSGAWRVFLLGLVIGLPVAIITIVLILLALSPLLLLITGDEAPMIVGILLTIFAVLFVFGILFIIRAVISPIQELAWRRAVLDDQAVLSTLVDIFGLITRNLKDVLIVWLLMFGVGLGWAVVSIFVAIVAVFAAIVIGGIPGVLVYLISSSVVGAAIAGGIPALLVLIVITSAVSGVYLVFQSTVWTLAYLDIQKLDSDGEQDEEESDDSVDMLATIP